MPTIPESPAEQDAAAPSPEQAWWSVLSQSSDGFAKWRRGDSSPFQSSPGWERLVRILDVAEVDLLTLVDQELGQSQLDQPPSEFRWLDLPAGSQAPIKIGASQLPTATGVWLLLLPVQSAEKRQDVVTGIADRRLLQDELETRFRADRSFAVVFVDLDGFKQVNDELGHLAGDQALREIAQRMDRRLRHKDLVARFGGDEFVVLVDEVGSESELEPILARIRQAIAEPLESIASKHDLSASIGWAFSDAGHTSTDEMLAAADQRMYANKQAAGKNRPAAKS